MCSRAGYQSVAILRNPPTCIQITNSGRIVKKIFFLQTGRNIGLLGTGNLTVRVWSVTSEESNGNAIHRFLLCGPTARFIRSG